MREGSPPPAGGGRPSRCESPGVSPPENFVNSDAKSYILVTTCCEISCFLKTTAKKLGTNTLLVSRPKSWRTLQFVVAPLVVRTGAVLDRIFIFVVSNPSIYTNMAAANCVVITNGGGLLEQPISTNSVRATYFLSASCDWL